MGLFGKKKNKQAAAAEEAAQAQLRQAQAAQAALAARNAEIAAAESARKAKIDSERLKEESILANITAKRKDIDNLERALAGFETERKRLIQLALKARQEKRTNDSNAHMRAVTRLKKRIEQYNISVVRNQEQLDALEDASTIKQGVKGNKQFVENMAELKIDKEDYEEDLQNIREQIDAVNEVNLTIQADANLNKGIYDEDEANAELDAYEAELAAEGAAVDIPSVPGNLPTMPVAQPSASASEEDEIRRLEAALQM